jgi:carbohydrate-binding DOMON domain-containing protein
VVVARTDEVGDDNGPGPYTYPTDSAFYDGAFDLIGFYVVDTGSRYEFVFQISGGIQDTFSTGGAFSIQHFQVYFRDPESNIQPSSAARNGVNADIDGGYNFRIIASGPNDGDSGFSAVEDPDFTVISQDFTFARYDSIDAAAFSVPKSAIGNGNIERMDILPLVLGYEGFNSSNVRGVYSTSAGFKFGGGVGDPNNDGPQTGNDPNVLDTLTPADVTQSEALGYSSSSEAAIPMVPAQQSPVEKFKSADGSVDADNVRAAREYWSNNRAVPGTNGESLSYADVRDLITATGGDGS